MARKPANPRTAPRTSAARVNLLMLLLLSAVERAAEAEGRRRGAAGRHCVGRRALLLDCVARGMTIAPSLAAGDGALGFWKALRQVFPTTREQRCWAHKTANVLDRLPKGQQPKAKAMLHDIWQAGTKAEAEKAFDLFVATWEAK